MTLSITKISHYVVCHYAERQVIFIVMPTAIILSIIMLNDVMMGVVGSFAQCRIADAISFQWIFLVVVKS